MIEIMYNEWIRWVQLTIALCDMEVKGRVGMFKRSTYIVITSSTGRHHEAQLVRQLTQWPPLFRSMLCILCWCRDNGLRYLCWWELQLSLHWYIQVGPQVGVLNCHGCFSHQSAGCARRHCHCLNCCPWVHDIGSALSRQRDHTWCTLCILDAWHPGSLGEALVSFA